MVTHWAVATGVGLEHGWFFQPTIFTGVTPGSRLEQEEIFGPVLSVVRSKSFDEAIGLDGVPGRTSIMMAGMQGSVLPIVVAHGEGREF